MRTRGQYYLGVATAVVGALLACVAWAPKVHAYENWSDGCNGCHGDFTANGYVSAHDGQAWSVTVGTVTYTSLHNVHRRYMLSISGTTSDCETCHINSSTRTPVSLKSSGGGIGFAGLSCLGCHGRPQDGGVGLRQHHFRTGTVDCVDCHDDADPASYTPAGENTAPSYYFTPDAQHPRKPTNPCNPGGVGENSAGGPAGLDNDGDNLYDTNDPDCQVVNPCAGFTPTTCSVPGQQGACAVSQTVCDSATGAITCPQTVQPVAETCNGVDDNCDGSIDNITPVACQTGQPGICAAGTTACVSGALVCNRNVQPSAEVCNGVDDNCDGTVDNVTSTACTVPGQVGPCANGRTACQAGTQICQQTIEPASEAPPGSAVCADSVDNDCDGAIDLADPECQFPPEANCFDGADNNGDGVTDCADPTCANAVGASTACGVGACAASGNRVCRDGAEIDTCSAGTPTAEVCDNLDNDCDGQLDDGIASVACSTGLPGTCAAGTTACVNGQTVCNQTTEAGTEGPYPTNCTDGQDNDCDGHTDAADPGCTIAAEGNCFDGLDNNSDGRTDCADPTCADTVGPGTTCGVGACSATGNRVCRNGAEVDTCAAGSPTEEVCDNRDNDCDGQVDDGITSVACSTGLPGICAAGTSACVNGQTVCNQTTEAGTEGPYPTNCTDGQDNDCDGLSDADDPGCAIGAEGNCFDGLDNNSDGRTDCADPSCANETGPATTCGLGACAAAGHKVCRDGAEVDTCVAGEPTTEVCDNRDNDCDGQVDDGIAPVAITCGTGVCQAQGQRLCVGGQLVDQCTPGQGGVEMCNNLDDDCDGTIDNIAAEATTCGTGACASTGQRVCQNGETVDTCTPLPAGTEGPFTSSTCTDTIDNDCDGSTDAADPGCEVVCVPQPEVCDGVDNDCNGQVDDGIAPIAITCGVGACQSVGEQVCENGALAGRCTPLPAGVEGPSGDPTCADSVDNNCNGRTDADDPNCVPVCEPTTEMCDGVDNDCDGVIDNDIPATPTTCGVGACASTGQLECQNGQFVDTCVPGTAGLEQFGVGDTCSDNSDNDCDSMVDAADPGCFPPPVEQACFDNADNDGDGVVDCADPDCTGAVDGRCDTGFAGQCATGELRCVNGAASCVQLVLPQPEICTDGLDNDCDGLTDAADPDCQAPPVEQACFDGLDNDHDGLVDCADPDCAGAVDGPCDTGLAGACAAGQVQCVPGNAAPQCVQTVFPQREICTDGIDNDCDGLTDQADPDCQTVQICHVPGGNASKVKLITVEPDAVRAHLRHGDFLPGPDGTCHRGERRRDRHAEED